MLQGFFRKGNVLMEIGQRTEALMQFYRCLNLQADFAPAKSQIKKVGYLTSFHIYLKCCIICSGPFMTYIMDISCIITILESSSLACIRVCVNEDML